VTLSGSTRTIFLITELMEVLVALGRMECLDKMECLGGEGVMGLMVAMAEILLRQQLALTACS
jgi:hypothetical protein